MAITTLSSREFNQDTGRAKRAARKGPVFITDRGRPAHVLLSIDEYQEITNKRKSIVDLLAMPGAAEIEFEPLRLGSELFKPVDLS
jgi:prevent-host-death family protein